MNFAQILRARASGRPVMPAPAETEVRDTRAHADQYPDAATEYRAAWGERRWAIDTPNGPQYIDNTGVRAVQERLAAEGPPIGWIDAPHTGVADPVLAPLYAAALADNARIVVQGPVGGPRVLEGGQ